MIIHGDCLDVMRGMDATSVDAIVTDPPYGLEFMGKEWDKFGGKPVGDGYNGNGGMKRYFKGNKPIYKWDMVAFQEFIFNFASEALRVAKPGAHLLAFGGTRTFHRLTCAIEDAGWEIRDCLGWIYGSGFPKSHNLKGEHEGWGTALKPAWEPIILARKPLDGTVAANVQKWGTGAVNVDGCRVKWAGTKDAKAAAVGFRRSQANGAETVSYGPTNRDGIPEYDNSVPGRWPANIILSWPEDEYALRDDLTPAQIKELAEWLSAKVE